jgi:hypothetical protein
MAAEEEPSQWSRLKVISATAVYVDVCMVTLSSIVTTGVSESHFLCDTPVAMFPVQYALRLK